MSRELRIAGRLEFEHILKQGSWLNMGEIWLSVIKSQRLNRRIGDEVTIRQDGLAV